VFPDVFDSEIIGEGSHHQGKSGHSHDEEDCNSGPAGTLADTFPEFIVPEKGGEAGKKAVDAQA
jgi:hypothetical protein